MIYRAVAISAALLCGVWLPVPAYAAPPSRIEVVNGTCDPSSHTAEGPLGADLTKRQSRFYCDSAAITFFDDYKGHVMVQFAQKESHHSPILGFAGRVEDDGIMMAVDHVYLAPGQATTVSVSGYWTAECDTRREWRLMAGSVLTAADIVANPDLKLLPWGSQRPEAVPLELKLFRQSGAARALPGAAGLHAMRKSRTAPRWLLPIVPKEI
jgi:hypothetical protein